MAFVGLLRLAMNVIVIVVGLKRFTVSNIKTTLICRPSQSGFSCSDLYQPVADACRSINSNDYSHYDSF